MLSPRMTALSLKMTELSLLRGCPLCVCVCVTRGEHKSRAQWRVGLTVRWPLHSPAARNGLPVALRSLRPGQPLSSTDTHTRAHTHTHTRAHAHTRTHAHTHTHT